jgi:HK97 family phage major capsid protein
MSTPTDAMIGHIQAELEERNAFVQGSIAAAQDSQRDLTDSEKELLTKSSARIDELNDQLEHLQRAQRSTMVARESIQRVNNDLMTARRTIDKGPVEYRSAGEYIADLYAAKMGDRDSAERIEVFHRVAAHQTTGDNPGLLPERIVEPVVNGVDVNRPLVSAIGPQNLGFGSWAYARVTQHTLVGVQSAEKTELASRKMTVTKTAITAPTYGGYVNVSRQDIRRSTPGILDMIIGDLAGQYAIETEDACATELIANSTPGTIEIPATPTAIGIATAVYGAAGQAAALLRTANIPATGPILAVSPDMLGIVGPFFPTVNPQNAYSGGFGADTLAMQGPQGQIANLTVVLGTGLPAETVLFLYRSAVRCYEDRYGAMTVDEPSVWGTQVGYAGDFETVVFDDGGVIAIAQT